MNPEYEGSVNKNSAEITNHDPATAVGELFYGPESLKQMMDFYTTAGHVLSSAIGGTLSTASIALGSGIQRGPETSVPNPQPVINSSIGGTV